MTKLYFLPIEGQGTEHIEALSSYLTRLAEVHTVSVGVLLKYLRASGGRNLAMLVQGHEAFATCIRPKPLIAELLTLLEAALDLDHGALEASTFLALEKCFGRSEANYAINIRWCTACFREQVKSGRPVYFKVVWQLNQVHRCHVHGVRLRQSCPNCGHFPFGYLNTYLPRNRCGCCHWILDETVPADIVPAQAMDTEIYALIQYIASNPGVRFPGGGVSKVVTTLLEEAKNTGTEKALYRILPRQDCLDFAKARTNVSMLSTLQIAYRLRLPLVAVLQGDVTGTTRSLLEMNEEELPHSLASVQRCYWSTKEGRVGRLAHSFWLKRPELDEPLPSLEY